VRRVVMLTYRMSMGFGVDLVVDQLCRSLKNQGFDCVVGCIEHSRPYPHLDIRVLPRVSRAIVSFVEGLQPAFVIAHTSPFFEVLPLLRGKAVCIGYEHGDPTPALFPHDSLERERTKSAKLRGVYPAIPAVIAISRFVARDIGWPRAEVVYNGCDHAPLYPPKELASIEGRPLRVGTLMRLGLVEASYKGNAFFIELVRRTRDLGADIEFHVMGRGTPEDASAFERQGIRVHLNAPNAAKWDYLHQLDVFVTCSLWEGFDLPLAEALAVGTAAFALDTGAHPEVTPLVAADVNELAVQLLQYDTNRALLLEHSHIASRFVQRHYRWDGAAARLAAILNDEARWRRATWLSPLARWRCRRALMGMDFSDLTKTPLARAERKFFEVLVPQFQQRVQQKGLPVAVAEIGHKLTRAMMRRLTRS
jgi:glycosyltransferase involved in cell wall biosynthesis